MQRTRLIHLVSLVTLLRTFRDFLDRLQLPLPFLGREDQVIDPPEFGHSISYHPITLSTIRSQQLLLSISLHPEPVALRLQSLIVREEAPSPLFLSLCLLFFGRNLAL